MITLIYVASYILAIIAFCVWDAFVGFPFEWDGYKNPPLALAAVFWPLTVPIVLVAAISNFLFNVKEARLKKEENMARVRVAAEKEMNQYLEQVEEELKSYARKNSYKA